MPADTGRIRRPRYEYKFIVHGDWRMDPDCSDWVPNDRGSLNRVIVV